MERKRLILWVVVKNQVKYRSIDLEIKLIDLTVPSSAKSVSWIWWHVLIFLTSHGPMSGLQHWEQLQYFFLKHQFLYSDSFKPSYPQMHTYPFLVHLTYLKVSLYELSHKLACYFENWDYQTLLWENVLWNLSKWNLQRGKVINDHMSSAFSYILSFAIKLIEVTGHV